MEKSCLHLLPTVHPILSSIFVFSSILSTPATMKIIQNWDIFEVKFEQIFPSNGSPFSDRRGYQRRGIYFGVILTIFLIISTNDTSEESCKFLKRLPLSQWMIPYICYIFGNFTWFTATHSFFEDIKFIVMLRSISGAFSQVSHSQNF